MDSDEEAGGALDLLLRKAAPPKRPDRND